MVKFIIEIPKGSKRRIHFNKKLNKFIDLGPIADQIPLNNGIMPLDYGFIKNTFNPSDNDELDAVLLSNLKYKTGDEINAASIGLLRREDGDDKVILIDLSVQYKDWQSVPKQLQTDILNFIGYKSKIISVEDNKETEIFIKSLLIAPN